MRRYETEATVDQDYRQTRPRPRVSDQVSLSDQTGSPGWSQ